MTDRRRAPLVALLALAVAALAAPPARGDDALWALLQQGGQVVMLRHGATDGGVGDPAGFRLDDCATQRNLSEAGRNDARRIGAAFRARGIPIAGARSSRWCRCLETGRLAFGTVEPWPALDSQFHDKSRAEEQARAVRQQAGERPAGGNLIMISHGTNIAAWTGIFLAPGEMLVLTPQGNGAFTVAGRIAPGSLAGR